MKVEGYLFVGCAVFFAGADIVYWHYSKDPTGTTALALSVGLAFLSGFYILFTGRRLSLRPEDNPQGEIAEGTGELGFFSPHSWWRPARARPRGTGSRQPPRPPGSPSPPAT